MLSMARDGKSVMRKFWRLGTFENRTSYLQTIALARYWTSLKLPPSPPKRLNPIRQLPSFVADSIYMASAPCLAASFRIAFTASASVSYSPAGGVMIPITMCGRCGGFSRYCTCTLETAGLFAAIGIHVSVPAHETSCMKAKITAVFFSIEVRI
jgi:hypothetical protein